MERTKQPRDKTKKRSLKGNKKPGVKSSCTKEVVQEAFRYCLLGATNRELAEFFDVDKTTVGYWYKTNPEFAQAVDEGRFKADAKVAEALYLAAKGYEHTVVKFFKIPVTDKEYDADGNVIREKKYTKIKKVRYTKKYKPDVKAIKKILASRHREQWGDTFHVQHKHAHMHVGGTNIHDIMDGLNQYSDDELRAIAKLGLSEKQKELTNGNGSPHGGN